MSEARASGIAINYVYNYVLIKLGKDACNKIKYAYDLGEAESGVNGRDGSIIDGSWYSMEDYADLIEIVDSMHPYDKVVNGEKTKYGRIRNIGLFHGFDGLPEHVRIGIGKSGIKNIMDTSPHYIRKHLFDLDIRVSETAPGTSFGISVEYNSNENNREMLMENMAGLYEGVFRLKRMKPAVYNRLSPRGFDIFVDAKKSV